MQAFSLSRPLVAFGQAGGGPWLTSDGISSVDSMQSWRFLTIIHFSGISPYEPTSLVIPPWKPPVGGWPTTQATGSELAGRYTGVKAIGIPASVPR